MTEVSRPEVRLLLACARSSRPEKADGIRTLLREPLDWDYLLSLARGHRVMPLLSWNLRDVPPEDVPPGVLQQLEGHFRSNSLRNLSLTAQLIELIDALEAQGIPSIPYKGPSLAASFYGNLALREFIDLDLLIQRHDVARAGDLLGSLGYERLEALTPAQEEAFLRSQREHVFVRRDGGGTVELHWALTPKHFAFSLDPRLLWERAERTSLGRRTVLTFSAEDQLLSLCVHGSKHLWQRLGWICDINELVRVRTDIDWSRLLRSAKGLGSERMLLLGLALAQDLLDAALPHEIEKLARGDAAVGALVGEVKGRLFAEHDHGSGVLETGNVDESRFHPFRTRVRERLRDKVRYCVYTMLIPTVEDWTFVPMPRILFPLYYVLRPLRLAGRYGQRLVKRP